MAKTFNAKQLQDLIKILFDSYLKLPAKTGRNFSDYYICIGCNRINDEAVSCKCGKTSTTKKPRKKRSKKKPGIPKAIKMFMPL